MPCRIHRGFDPYRHWPWPWSLKLTLYMRYRPKPAPQNAQFLKMLITFLFLDVLLSYFLCICILTRSFCPYKILPPVTLTLGLRLCHKFWILLGPGHDSTIFLFIFTHFPWKSLSICREIVQNYEYIKDAHHKMTF